MTPAPHQTRRQTTKKKNEKQSLPTFVRWRGIFDTMEGCVRTFLFSKLGLGQETISQTRQRRVRLRVFVLLFLKSFSLFVPLASVKLKVQLGATKRQCVQHSIQNR